MWLGAEIKSIKCVMGSSAAHDWKYFSPFACFLRTNRAPWDLVAPLDLLENPEMM